MPPTAPHKLGPEMSPTLPFELQEIVVRFVYRLSQSHNINYRTLAVCARVCRDWAPLAQHLLFRRLPEAIIVGPTLSVQDRLTMLEQSPAPGASVRSLVIGFRSNSPDNSSDWLRLLRCCPNVARLVISGSIPVQFDIRTPLSTLNIQPTVLDLMGVNSRGDRNLNVLLELWPSVRCLLTPRFLRTPARLNPTLFGQSGQLRGLRVVALLNLLSRTEKHCSIRELHITGQSTWNVGGTAESVLAAHVRSLTVPTLAPPNILEAFTRLEELVIRTLRSWPPTLPRSIQHFGYHQQDRAPSEELREPLETLDHFVSVLSALPALRLVTATRTSSDEILASLEEMCRSRDVEFIVYPDAASFPVSRPPD